MFRICVPPASGIILTRSLRQDLGMLRPIEHLIFYLLAKEDLILSQTFLAALTTGQAKQKILG